MKKSFLASLALWSSMAFSNPLGWVEPPPPKAPSGSVALTIDACSSKFDMELAHELQRKNIKTTFFVTGKFVRGNPEAYEFLVSHPETFQLGNHGKEHHAPILEERGPFGLPSVKNEEGLHEEVFDVDQLLSKTKNRTRAYRGAGALYSQKVLGLLQEKDIRLAGYDIAPDAGGTAPLKTVESKVASAKEGSIILVHATRPGTGLGRAIISGVNGLESRGVRFVWWTELHQ